MNIISEKQNYNKIKLLSELIKNSTHPIVFTGAGISTGSGLKDFRGKTGMWKDINPMKLATVNALYNNRDKFIEFYRTRIITVNSCKPNQGHKILAKWLKNRIIKCIITQNVDRYHQAASIELNHDVGAESILELHGNITTLRCIECGREYSSIMYQNKHMECKLCKGFLRPNVVLFGESLDEEVVYRAETEAIKSDLFIVIGTSLTVSPANTLVDLAFNYPNNNKAKIIIINKEITPYDDASLVTFHDQNIGNVLSSTNNILEHN
jgi:NAD-dependent protein deacetylase/lipoamidase